MWWKIVPSDKLNICWILILGMALGLGESDKTTAKQILKRRQLPLKDFEQKTGMFFIN